MAVATLQAWDALRARRRRSRHPAAPGLTSVVLMEHEHVLPRGRSAAAAREDVDALVVRLFDQEATSLVRLARLFVEDRIAAEDLVQEAFIRLARSAHRIRDPDKAAAYLRSIVLNLARDHNRRGLLSLRHHLPRSQHAPSPESELLASEDRRAVLAALRALPRRQRDAVVLRYDVELGIDEIAETMGISRNSVKTHLRRGLAALEQRLGGGP